MKEKQEFPHIKTMIEKKKKYLNRDTWTRFEGHHM
jgi:hypothetical protein